MRVIRWGSKEFTVSRRENACYFEAARFVVVLREEEG
jgi:hypothetical protein